MSYVNLEAKVWICQCCVMHDMLLFNLETFVVM